MMYTLDTNILMYHLNDDDAEVSSFLERRFETEIFFLPTIAIVEFLAFSELTLESKYAFDAVVPFLRVVPLDYIIALTAGELRSHYKLKLGDSVVAATALSKNSVLVTRNIRDFKNVPSLEVQSL